MPTEVIWNENHFVIVYSGVVRIEESMAAYDEVSRNGRYDSSMFGIADCRSIMHADYDAKDFDLHAAYAKAVALYGSRKGFRVGVVVASKEVEEIVLSFIASTKKFRESWVRRVFWDYDEALRWASGAGSSA